MRLNQLFTEADNDPYAKYWNPAEKEMEKQKAAEVGDRQALQRMYDAGKSEEQDAKAVEAELVRMGMDRDSSTLSRVDKEPFKTVQVNFKGGLYTVKAYMVDTYDGPEIRAEFYAPDGKVCDVHQESMGVDSMIEMWKEIGDHGPIRRRDETKF